MTRSEMLSAVKESIENLCLTTDAAEIFRLRCSVRQNLQRCYQADYFKLLSSTIDILLNDIERYTLQKARGTDFPVDARSAGAAVDALCQLVLESGVGFASESRERLVS